MVLGQLWNNTNNGRECIRGMAVAIHVRSCSGQYSCRGDYRLSYSAIYSLPAPSRMHGRRQKHQISVKSLNRTPSLKWTYHNSFIRRLWVLKMLKSHDVLSIQTLRNHLMIGSFIGTSTVAVMVWVSGSILSSCMLISPQITFHRFLWEKWTKFTN